MGFWTWAADLVSALCLPMLFVGGAAAGLIVIARKGGKEVSKETYGIALGVVLGFVSQIVITSFDQFRQEQVLKRAAFKLLEQDARSIYRTMWLMEGLVARGYRPSGTLKMHYWDILKQDPKFLMLAQNPKFADIFKDFHDFESMNGVVAEARTGRKDAGMAASAIFLTTIREGAHRELLLKFITQRDIDEWDRKHKEKLGAEQSQRAAQGKPN